MPDIPEDALEAATDEVTRWMLEYDWMTGLNAEQVRSVSRDAVTRALEVAAPTLGEHAASKILAHMEAHGGQDFRRRHAYRMHMQTAARIAAGAFLAEDDLDRLAVEAIVRGDYIACEIPEVPDA